MKVYLLISLLLVGCGWVSHKEIEAATNACAPHGGVKFVSVMVGSQSYEVICMNGILIKEKMK